jgi:nucleoside-diphosphate-sugar epimerase
MGPDKVIVTGCSGFVGRNLVNALLANGYEVVGISRTDPKITGLQHVKADLTKPGLPYFGREYSVVHVAALTKEGKSAELASVNIEGTKKALQLAGGRFIHISSSSVYDLGKNSFSVLEEEALTSNRFYNEYSRTKHVADMLVLGDEHSDLLPIVLRPHAVYGKDDTTLFPRLQKRIKRNSLLLPNAGQVEHSLTHVDNLTQAVLCSLRASAEIHGAFNVSDKDTVVLSEAIQSLTDSGLHIRNLPLQMALVLSKLSDNFTSVNREPKFSEYTVRQVGMNRTYSLEKASDKLGYSPSCNKLVESYR